ncbi:NAD(P)-binding protein [Piedraia hortae CBS 480.64]|uniref:3-dehydrosphinganine reductase n=1 Tax=Piedraia hortae CBS 480.64 TaxID=1314780 RepID=A0A6A7C647_9PEZI|nr:NAD(P)-binding protein [Piedraia hortae CBS 480.64]
MATGLPWALAILCILLGVLAVGLVPTKNHFDVEGRTVLITGGSQGMGLAVAKLLSRKGANVVIIARNISKLTEALASIKAVSKNPTTQRFHLISADVTEPSENVRILHEVTLWNSGQPPDIVWAIAGSAHPTLFFQTPISTLRSQMDLNYWAATYLAHATLQLWLKPSTTKTPKQRHFIVTSSVVCFCGIAGYAPYSPAKSALRSLTDTLRSEVNLYNGYRSANPKGPEAEVKVHCIVPGTITSPGFEHEQVIKAEVTKLLEESDPKQTAEEVAEAAVRGLERGGGLVTTQWLGLAMKTGQLGNSPRSRVLLETALSWVVSVVWLVVGPQMEGTVFRYGRGNDVMLPSE